jgi:hypothetical protein
VLKPLELPASSIESGVLLTTACGLASWKVSDVLDQLAALRRAAALTTETLHQNSP